MKILISGAGRHEWHEEAWGRSLRSLGHDVTLFATAPFVQSFADRLSERFLRGPLIARVNDAFLRVADQVKPDLFVAYRALLLVAETIETLRRSHRTRLVCYQNDNIFGPLRGKTYWRFFRRAIPTFDLHLVYRESDVRQYEQLGARSVRVLQSHYLPWLHRRLPIRLSTPIDVGFYGHCEDDGRVELLDQLIRTVPAQYSVRGSAWAKYGKRRAWAEYDTRELQGEEYVRAINNTRIVLVFLSKLNEDTYTRRVFEIPASGTFMLCERTRDMQALYQEDQEAVFFDSGQELIDKVRYYLARDSEREAIARAGERRALQSGYDIYSRMRSWLGALES
jgi:spore maturation protein CgeB